MKIKTCYTSTFKNIGSSLAESAIILAQDCYNLINAPVSCIGIYYKCENN